MSLGVVWHRRRADIAWRRRLLGWQYGRLLDRWWGNRQAGSADRGYVRTGDRWRWL